MAWMCTEEVQWIYSTCRVVRRRKRGSSQQRFTDIAKKGVQRVVETEEDASRKSEEDEDEVEVEGKRRRVDKEVYGALPKPPRYCFADVCI